MMAYMKWVSLIRDAVSELQARGMLGVLAAATKIQEYRLRDWAAKNTIDDLSHAELTALHAAFSEGVVEIISESTKNELSTGYSQTERSESECSGSSSSLTENCGFAFDSSD